MEGPIQRSEPALEYDLIDFTSTHTSWIGSRRAVSWERCPSTCKARTEYRSGLHRGDNTHAMRRCLAIAFLGPTQFVAGLAFPLIFDALIASRRSLIPAIWKDEYKIQ